MKNILAISIYPYAIGVRKVPPPTPTLFFKNIYCHDPTYIRLAGQGTTKLTRAILIETRLISVYKYRWKPPTKRVVTKWHTGIGFSLQVGYR